MTEKDLEGLMLMHKRIIGNLEEFSMPAKQQMEKLKVLYLLMNWYQTFPILHYNMQKYYLTTVG